MSHCEPKTASGSSWVTVEGYLAHRNGDIRDCGAATVVAGQSFVTIDGQLWAVRGDPNSHGNGNLINSQSFVTMNGIPVIRVTPDSANPDNLCGSEE